MTFSDSLLIAQTIVLVLTGAVIVWYTIETARLRRTAQRQLESQLRQVDAQLEQTETQVRPFVVLIPDKGKGSATVENIGFGPALNIRIPPVLVHQRIAEHPVSLRFPENLPILKPGERISIPVQSFVADKEFGDFFSAALHPEFAHDRLEVGIQYENIQLKSYMVVQTTEPHSMIVSGFRPGKT